MARDYAAEYARRVASGRARGLTRTQARGHPSPGEPPASAIRAGVRSPWDVNLRRDPLDPERNLMTYKGRDYRITRRKAVDIVDRSEAQIAEAGREGSGPFAWAASPS